MKYNDAVANSKGSFGSLESKYLGLKSRSEKRESEWTAEIRILKKEKTRLLNKNKVFPHFTYDFLE